MTDRELMQQVLHLLDDINQYSLPPTGIPLPAEIDHVMEALRARLAQPIITDEIKADKAEPVAWITRRTKDGKKMLEVGEVASNPAYIAVHKEWVWEPLYTTPPQREWQGLTPDESAELTYAPIAEIEAKLKEKNG